MLRPDPWHGKFLGMLSIRVTHSGLPIIQGLGHPGYVGHRNGSNSGIALFLCSVFMFTCKSPAGWECYCPRFADSDTEAQPGPNACFLTLRIQVWEFVLVQRPDMSKRLELIIAIEGHLIWVLPPATGLHPLVSSDQGDLESKLHQHILKSLPVIASPGGLKRRHAFGSQVHYSLLGSIVLLRG